MPRTTAGHRYPHISSTARVHDHRVCAAVVEKIIKAVAAGREPWGTVHRLPVVADEQAAQNLRNRVFGGKWCGQLEDRYGTQHSISVKYELPDGQLTDRRVPQADGYHLVAIIWGPVDVGRRKVITDARAGKPLAYNPLAKGE